MQVKDAMCTEFTIVSPDTTLQEAAQFMRDGDFGYLPVGAGDRLQGTVTDRDIVIRGLAEGYEADTPVAEVITENVIYCFDDDDLKNAADTMSSQQIRRLIVLNRDKRMVGILSLGDIARVTNDKGLVGHAETGVAQVS